MTEKPRKRIYVAGALNAMAVDYISNLHQMIHFANLIRKTGFAVFVPGLDFLMGLQDGNWEYEDYFNNSLPWLEISDGMFIVPSSEFSKGTKREKHRAWELKIPIFTTIADLKYGFEEKE